VTAPALETFREYAKDRRVIPVTRRLLADAETPIGVYGKLAAEREGTFLLESAENGGVWSRYSFIGVRSSATLTERNGEAVWTGNPPVGLPQTGDPLQALRETLEILHTPRLPDLPPLTGGMVGFLGYDAVRRLERLPDTTTDDLGLPELTFLFATDLAALDHETGEIWLIANAVNWDDSDERVDEAYADAVRRLDAMERDLARPTPSLSRSGSSCRAVPPRSTSTGCCGARTPARTCTWFAWTASTSSGPARRPWSRSPRTR
jgi:anthranilate synthase component 1